MIIVIMKSKKCFFAAVHHTRNKMHAKVGRRTDIGGSERQHEARRKKGAAKNQG